MISAFQKKEGWEQISQGFYHLTKQDKNYYTDYYIYLVYLYQIYFYIGIHWNNVSELIQLHFQLKYV